METKEALNITNLNDDCLFQILQTASLEDRVNLESVCERWQYFCSLLWKKVYSFDVCSQDLGHINPLLDPEDFGESDINALVCQQVFERVFPHLKMINLSRVEFPQITTLMDMWHICSCHFNSNILPAGTLNHLKDLLLKYEKLEELWLCRCVIDVDDEFLSKLFTKNVKLRKLVLTEYILTGECFSHLSSEVLESLILFECIIQQPQHLNSIVSRASNLSTLSIRCRGYVSESQQVGVSLGSSDNFFGRNENGDYDVSRGLLCAICNLENLTVLNLKYSELSDDMLKCIALKCSNLKVLDLQWCDRITDTGLEYTKLMPKLKCLVIGSEMSFEEDVTDTGLLALNRNLKVLVIRETKFSGSALLTLLREMPDLQALDISRCRQLNNAFIESAIDIVKRREGRVPLEIAVYETGIEIEKIRNDCPLVKFDSLYLSVHEKYY